MACRKNHVWNDLPAARTLCRARSEFTGPCQALRLLNCLPNHANCETASRITAPFVAAKPASGDWKPINELPAAPAGRRQALLLSNVTSGDRPWWRSTATRPASSNALRPRLATRGERPDDLNFDGTNRNVLDFFMPCRCQATRPTASALPGSCMATFQPQPGHRTFQERFTRFVVGSFRAWLAWQWLASNLQMTDIKRVN